MITLSKYILMLQVSEFVSGILVGLIWGVTNPLIKRGSLKVEQRKATAGSQCSWLEQWMPLLVPQLINQVCKYHVL